MKKFLAHWRNNMRQTSIYDFIECSNPSFHLVQSLQQEQTQNQEKSIINKFSSDELETIRKFYTLASRFKFEGIQKFSTASIEDIFSMGGPTVTKILNGYYIELAREKEALYENKK